MTTRSRERQGISERPDFQFSAGRHSASYIRHSQDLLPRRMRYRLGAFSLRRLRLFAHDVAAAVDANEMYELQRTDRRRQRPRVAARASCSLLPERSKACATRKTPSSNCDACYERLVKIGDLAGIRTTRAIATNIHFHELSARERDRSRASRSATPMRFRILARDRRDASENFGEPRSSLPDRLTENLNVECARHWIRRGVDSAVAK